MSKFILFVFLGALGFIFSACSKENLDPNTSEQFQSELKKIREYLNQNNIKADSTPEGLYYHIDYTNDSLENIYPSLHSDIIVDYKGYLLDGKVFQTKFNVAFNLNSVIDGWRIGIPKLKQGERGRLFIPSRLAYGSSGTATIPANSTLIFEVNLIEVVQ